MSPGSNRTFSLEWDTDSIRVNCMPLCKIRMEKQDLPEFCCLCLLLYRLDQLQLCRLDQENLFLIYKRWIILHVSHDRGMYSLTHRRIWESTPTSSISEATKGKQQLRCPQCLLSWHVRIMWTWGPWASACYLMGMGLVAQSVSPS